MFSVSKSERLKGDWARTSRPSYDSSPTRGVKLGEECARYVIEFFVSNLRLNLLYARECDTRTLGSLGNYRSVAKKFSSTAALYKSFVDYLTGEQD